MTNPQPEEIRPTSQIERLEDKIESRFQIVNDKIENLTITVATIKNDLTWIKWLFGIFSSLIIVLLGTMLTVLFKLLNSI